jgi:prepilin-type N-terminal cleavage/methylation domain-containing protein
MIKLKNNQKGMSLVEVMMAVAISSIVSLAVMKINENGMKGFNKVQTDTELNEFVGMIRTNLSNSTNCMFSLGETRPDNLGNTTADRPVPTIYRGTNAGGTWAVAGDKIPGGGWMLNSMTRRAFETNGGGLQGVCNLDLDVTRVKVAFGVTNKTVTIPIFCNINLSNEVESCESASTANDNYWTKNYEPGYEYLNYVSSINPGTGLPTGPSYVVVGPSRDAMVDPVIASLDINQDGFDWLLPQFMTGVRMPRENVLTWQQWGITESFNQVVVGEDCVAIMARNLADLLFLTI